jgi:adenosylcobinamide-phosphate synthase
LNRSILLPAAYFVDHLAGDPEWFPHPVRLIGAAVSIGESWLRRPGQSSSFELLSGTGLTIAVVGSSYWITAAIIRLAHRCSPVWGSTVELALAWTCLAARNLEQEATAVTAALQTGDLPHARARLARIVGRDTETLDSRGVSRAAIETVAESASDGIMAPLFYMALGGVPLAMAYKAVNTLDSMIGHADSSYFYFGKTAARLDDAANYLPSRISALAIVAAAKLLSHTDPQAAWRIWQRDGSKHKSPNAGQPESAMAGALHVSLGGDNTYAGELIPAQRIGAEFQPPSPDEATQAIRLVSVASLIGLSIGIVVICLVRARKRG